MVRCAAFFLWQPVAKLFDAEIESIFGFLKAKGQRPKLLSGLRAIWRGQVIDWPDSMALDWTRILLTNACLSRFTSKRYLD